MQGSTSILRLKGFKKPFLNWFNLGAEFCIYLFVRSSPEMILYKQQKQHKRPSELSL